MRDTFDHAGRTFTVRIEFDDTQEGPWEREDGHGPVSEWRRPNRHGYAHKRAGERPLCTDRHSARMYDMQEAQRIALRDGWGFGGKSVADHVAAGMTRRQIAAKAAEEDYKRLRAFCAGDWSYVSVIVTLEGPGTVNHSASLWGIESDAGAYLEEVRAELADEILSSVR